MSSIQQDTYTVHDAARDVLAKRDDVAAREHKHPATFRRWFGGTPGDAMCDHITNSVDSFARLLADYAVTYGEIDPWYLERYAAFTQLVDALGIDRDDWSLANVERIVTDLAAAVTA